MGEIFDCLAREFETQSEHVVVIAAEKLPEIFGLVLPGIIIWRRERVGEALFVFLLFRLVDPSDRIKNLNTCLSGGQDVENLRSGKSLVTALDVGVRVLG